MPRLNIVILDAIRPGAWTYVLWADVPVARQPFYASTGNLSAWKGALATDITNLQTGAVTEQSGVINTPGFTSTQLQAQLQSTWTAFQAFITGYNPWNHYGSTWDGTTWTSTGAA